MKARSIAASEVLNQHVLIETFLNSLGIFRETIILIWLLLFMGIAMGDIAVRRK